MKRKALIIRGGWDGHEPVQVSEVFKKVLAECDFDVEISDNIEAFSDAEKLSSLSLLVPVWTMGKASREILMPAINAVADGVGIAGCHGGMCDSFRESTDWQFMTGGQWVAHPGNDGVEYTVNIKHSSSNPIVEGIQDFKVRSEQYYMHVDPAVEVLATTRFHSVEGPHFSNGMVDMPVVWTKRWGKGKVFYNSLGHHADVFDIEPALTLMKRGFLWAAR